MSDLTMIRSLARCGAADAAWMAFEGAGLAARSDNAAILSLKGRLLKDRAMRADGAERLHLLRAAADAYGAAARLDNATYPRINAATLLYLRGDKAAAGVMANDVLAMLDAGDHDAETPYWIEATRAEALLLLGRLAEAQRAMHAAMAIAPGAREDRAATLRQFRRLLAADGADDGWLAPFAVGPVMAFRGPIGISAANDAERIRAAVRTCAPAMAIGALAAGADIIAAEAAIEQGAALHIILPAPPDVFRAASVAPQAGHWTARFDALLDAAEQVEWLNEPDGFSQGAMHLAEMMVDGLANAEAQALESRAVTLKVMRTSKPNELDDDDLAETMVVRVEGDTNHDTPALPAPVTARLWLGEAGSAKSSSAPILEAGSLFAGLRPGATLDAAVSDANHQPPRLAALRLLARPHTVVASRPAALVMAALCPSTRVVPAGEVDGADGPVAFYDLLPEQG